LDLITQEYLPKQDLLHQKLPVAPSLFKIAITCSQTAATAENQPTVADLQLLIQQHKGRVLALQATQQAAPNVVAAAPVAPVVTFAVTPQALNAKDLINYSTKQGSAIFDQGCKALDDKALANVFAMTLDQTVIFVEAFHHHAVAMG
jgi:hypothetical protein